VKRHVLIFGLVGGLLIATLQYTEYRFVVIEHSVELYGALVAILFATFGIWLGLRRREKIVVREVLAPLYQNPLVNMAYTIMEPLPVGLLITLISAALLRRKGTSSNSPADPPSPKPATTALSQILHDRCAALTRPAC
jgi:hypothetical protein